MNGLAVRIIHPAFEQFRKLSRFLHVVAAAMILAQAVHHYHQPASNHLFSWCLVIVAVDIVILVISNRNLLQEMSRVNLSFRFIECVVFLGVALLLIAQHDWIMGGTLALVFTAFAYLFYCEKRAAAAAVIAFNHIGITISGIPESRFLIWTKIQKIEARYDSICLDTAGGKILYFPLQEKLDYDELEQIHEFCRHYLGTAH